jgi:hypothetical protein
MKKEDLLNHLERWPEICRNKPTEILSLSDINNIDYLLKRLESAEKVIKYSYMHGLLDKESKKYQGEMCQRYYDEWFILLTNPPVSETSIKNDTLPK